MYVLLLPSSCIIILLIYLQARRISVDKFVSKVLNGANGSETKLAKTNGKSSRVSSDGHGPTRELPVTDAATGEGFYLFIT